MEIKDSAFYSIKETAQLVNKPTRTLQRIAKNNNYRKIDGRYLFTGTQIKKLLIKASEVPPTTRQTPNDTPQISRFADGRSGAAEQSSLLVQINQELQQEIENLKQENRDLKQQLTSEIPHQEKLKKAIQLITLEAMEQGVMHKVFTDEEYNDIIGTITEVDFQKEQVQYLKSRVEKQDDILNKLASQVSESIAENRERNFISAKEKGFDE